MEKIQYLVVLNGNSYASAQFDNLGDACDFVTNNDLSCCHIVKQVTLITKEEVLSF